MSQNPKLRGPEFWIRRLRLDIGNLTIGKANAEEAWRNECAKARGLENQVADLKTELREANAKNAALIRQDEFLHGLTTEQEQEIVSLRRERDTTQAELFKQGQVRRQHAEEIASLRAQLARVEEIKEAARKARDWLATMGAATPYGVIRWLTEALDASSTSPRDTAEGEPKWLVEETTVYTLDAAGHQNRIYANFQGRSADYKERCELAKRCAAALNAKEHL